MKEVKWCACLFQNCSDSWSPQQNNVSTPTSVSLLASSLTSNFPKPCTRDISFRNKVITIRSWILTESQDNTVTVKVVIHVIENYKMCPVVKASVHLTLARLINSSQRNFGILSTSRQNLIRNGPYNNLQRIQLHRQECRELHRQPRGVIPNESGLNSEYESPKQQV